MNTNSDVMQSVVRSAHTSRRYDTFDFMSLGLIVRTPHHCTCYWFSSVFWCSPCDSVRTGINQKPETSRVGELPNSHGRQRHLRVCRKSRSILNLLVFIRHVWQCVTIAPVSRHSLKDVETLCLCYSWVRKLAAVCKCERSSENNPEVSWNPCYSACVCVTFDSPGYDRK